MMKIKDLYLNNFAGLGEVSVSFDDNVTYLVGDNGSGKSTIGLSGIWFMFTGIVEKSSSGKELIGNRFRFIGDKEAFAQGIMTLYDGDIEIRVYRKMSADANEVKFVAPDGYKLNQKWLTDLFNVFMIAPKKFIDLSPKEQALTLGINTENFDKDIQKYKDEYTINNRLLKSLGTIEPVEETQYIESSEIQSKISEMIDFNNQQIDISEKYEKAKMTINDLMLQRENLINELSKIEDRIKAGNNYVANLPKPLPLKDSTETNKLIKSIEDNNKKYQLYREYLKKKEEYDSFKSSLVNITKKKEAIETGKIEYLKSFKFPVKGLSIDDEGNLNFEGRFLKEPYFSSGQLIKIVPLLFSAVNSTLKYVFLQQFNLLDDINQKDVIKYLTSNGYQVVIEYVSSEEIEGENCIVLKDVVKA